MSTPFVPDDFEVPLGMATDRFRLEPLGPEHNERDHEACRAELDVVLWETVSSWLAEAWPFRRPNYGHRN